MANLTISVDDETLKRARIRAIERGESVNAYLADMLDNYAGRPRQGAVMTSLKRLAVKASAGADAEGRTWSRAELHRV